MHSGDALGVGSYGRLVRKAALVGGRLVREAVHVVPQKHVQCSSADAGVGGRLVRKTTLEGGRLVRRAVHDDPRRR